MDGDLRVSARLTIPAAALTERFSRSGGPGGQHVNTSDTQVELSFDVTTLPPTLRERALERLHHRLADGVVTVTASDERSQRRNRELARERLAELLREATAPPPRKRRPTKPSKTAVEDRLQTKRRRAGTKQMRRPPADD